MPASCELDAESTDAESGRKQRARSKIAEADLAGGRYAGGVELGELQAAYEEIRAQAREVAGAPGDIVPRVLAHHGLYRDSLGNHAFPMVALHGALWGYDFFEVTGKLGEIVSYRYVFDAEEKVKRHAMLGRFAEGFRLSIARSSSTPSRTTTSPRATVERPARRRSCTRSCSRP